MVLKRYLELEGIVAYRIASVLSDYVWRIVFRWDWLNKRTLGVQFIEAVDSIAANIAEGFGRFHKKDKQKFYYNSRGSVYESVYWTEKTRTRNLTTKEEYGHILGELSKLPKEINYLVKITEEKLKK